MKLMIIGGIRGEDVCYVCTCQPEEVFDFLWKINTPHCGLPVIVLHVRMTTAMTSNCTI